MTTWEDLCRRCGQCCFEKLIEENGTIFYTATACRFLDPVSRECKVYHKRTNVDEDCMQLTPEVVKSICWLPADCGYVKYLKRDPKK